MSWFMVGDFQYDVDEAIVPPSRQAGSPMESREREVCVDPREIAGGVDCVIYQEISVRRSRPLALALVSSS